MVRRIRTKTIYCLSFLRDALFVRFTCNFCKRRECSSTTMMADETTPPPQPPKYENWIGTYANASQYSFALFVWVFLFVSEDVVVLETLYPDMLKPEKVIQSKSATRWLCRNRKVAVTIRPLLVAIQAPVILRVETNILPPPLSRPSSLSSPSSNANPIHNARQRFLVAVWTKRFRQIIVESSMFAWHSNHWSWKSDYWACLFHAFNYWTEEPFCLSASWLWN